ncbi:DinB family protein [Chitinophagaceae bacterium LB-8]|uniref:DinB family protein n=1 Tax=Paraflavisolibacter caeni TaxID=2982496 RepID=A0A9X3B9K7_9BACT|nr:DinB family protein [Paraflavisolibacter caeni]MCU7551436.1 DinB family protein [Paraflavisolibacter caeni]
METQTASNRTKALLALFDYQTKFFARALEGISEEDMHNRLNTQANHPAWLAGSLVQQRFMMAGETGTSFKQTGEELFKNNKGIQSGVKYPTTAEYLTDWERITPKAREALVTIDDKKLDSEIDMGGMKMTYYEMICFSIYREASIIGQLALWRRLLGYPALKYD